MVAATQADKEGLRRANQATAQLLQNLATLARPGVTTGDLNDYAMNYIAHLGATPVFATEEGFPGYINPFLPLAWLLAEHKRKSRR